MTEQQPRELPADCGIVRILDGASGYEVFLVIDPAGRLYWEGENREELAGWLTAHGEGGFYNEALMDWNSADLEAAAVKSPRRSRSRWWSRRRKAR